MNSITMTREIIHTQKIKLRCLHSAAHLCFYCNMIKLLLFGLVLVGTVYGALRLPLEGGAPSFFAPQIVPRGYGWPQFAPISGSLMFLSNVSKCEQFSGRIAFMVIQGNVDLRIKYLKDCGAIGVVIMGTDSLFAGSSFRRMWNLEPFTTKDEVYPVVEVAATNGTKILQFIGNASKEMPPRLLFAEVDSTDVSVWRIATYSSYLIIPLICGPLYFASAVVSAINLYRTKKYNVKHPRIPNIVNSLNFSGAVLRVIGMIDFQGFWQVMPFMLAGFLTNAGIGPIMSAIWFGAVLMFSITRKNIPAKWGFIVIRRDLWIYIIITCVLCLLDWINSLVINSNLTSRDVGISVGVVWTAVTAGFAMTLAIIYTIAFIKFVKAVARSDNLKGVRNVTRMRRLIFTNGAIALCIFGYSLISLIAWLGLAGYPDRSLAMYFGQPLLLGVASLIRAVGGYVDTNAAIEATSTDKELTGTNGTGSSGVRGTSTGGEASGQV